MAVLGIVPLGIYLAALADWAGDNPLADRLRSAVWIMVMTGVVSGLSWIAALATWLLGGTLGFISIFMGLISVASTIVVVVSVLQLAHIASWAISNHNSAAEIARRRQREAEAHEARLAQRSLAASAPPGAGSMRKSPASTPVAKQAGKSLPPRPSRMPTPGPTGNAEPTVAPADLLGGGAAPYFLKTRDARVDPPSGEAGAEPYAIAPDADEPPKA
ncbi:hypothetical protein J4558_23050 [Leptolyngbya sp. 15MV]|nr:hypothetical protein J4558_23050 [Leptolyngbya sp. 15MV]